MKLWNAIDWFEICCQKKLCLKQVLRSSRLTFLASHSHSSKQHSRRKHLAVIHWQIVCPALRSRGFCFFVHRSSCIFQSWTGRSRSRSQVVHKCDWQLQTAVEIVARQLSVYDQSRHDKAGGCIYQNPLQLSQSYILGNSHEHHHAAIRSCHYDICSTHSADGLLR